MASVDILSDDEDEMLCAPPALPAPSAQCETAVAAAPEEGGLRSVLVASLDLVDSDEEQPPPPPTAGAPAADCSPDLPTKTPSLPAAAAQVQNSVSVGAKAAGATIATESSEQHSHITNPITNTAADGKSIQIAPAISEAPAAAAQGPNKKNKTSTAGNKTPCQASATAVPVEALSDDDEDDLLTAAASAPAPAADKPPRPAVADVINHAVDPNPVPDISNPGAVAHVTTDSGQAGLKAEKTSPLPGSAAPASDDEAEDNLAIAAAPKISVPTPESGKGECSASAKTNMHADSLQASGSTGKKTPCKGSSTKRPCPAAADNEDTPAAKQPRQMPEVAPASASGPPKKAGGAAAKADTKDKKLSKAEMEAKVLDYMRQQNRPYNAQNVFDNLLGVVPKATVQALLDQFAGSGHVLLKEYGKIKVFLASQTGAATDVGQDASLQADVDQAQSQLKATKTQSDDLRKSVAQVRSKQAVRTEAKTAEEEAERLEKQACEKRASVKDGSAKVEEAATAEEVASTEKTFRTTHTEWRKRKRLCMELLKTLGEAMSLRVDKLVDKYGVDTDEDCGELIPDIKDL